MNATEFPLPGITSDILGKLIFILNNIYSLNHNVTEITEEQINEKYLKRLMNILTKI